MRGGTDEQGHIGHAPSGEAVDQASAEAADEAERAAERRDLLVGAIVSVGVGLTMMAVMSGPADRRGR